MSHPNLVEPRFPQGFTRLKVSFSASHREVLRVCVSSSEQIYFVFTVTYHYLPTYTVYILDSSTARVVYRMPVPWTKERRCVLIPDVADRGLKVRQLWDLTIFLKRLCKAKCLLRNNVAGPFRVYLL